MLFFCDIDGCISPGRFQPYDLENINKIRNTIKEKKLELILTSGRSQSYMECLSQVLDLDSPYICENGSAIFSSKEKSYIYSCDTSNLSIARDILMDNFKDKIIFEPNKEFSLSFRISSGFNKISEEFDYTKKLLSYVDGIDINHSNSAIDIIPKGSEKAIALDFIKSIYNEDYCIGFGDSFNDVKFLEKCNFTGCPQNSLERLKNIVNYVSKYESSRGLLDFLENSPYEWEHG